MRQSHLIAAGIVTLLACASFAQLPPGFVPTSPATGRKPGSVARPTSYTGYYQPPSVSKAPTSRPPSYSDYYKTQVDKYKRPPASSAQYIIDKYFYQNPNVSPYSHLMRNSGGTTNNYYDYTRPELDRRRRDMEAEVAPSIKTGGNYVGGQKSRSKPVPTATTNPYYQYYYGPPKK